MTTPKKVPNRYTTLRIYGEDLAWIADVSDLLGLSHAEFIHGLATGKYKITLSSTDEDLYDVLARVRRLRGE